MHKTGAILVEASIHGDRNAPDQARATIENGREILRSVGSTLSDVAEIDAFLVSMDDDGGFDEVCARDFDARARARGAGRDACPAAEPQQARAPARPEGIRHA